ncbi:MAG TPA: hypothetical protein VFS89_03820 [Nitrosospira sp.]|nr:hypothetical protein [Nitrosospira sp.]
MSTKFQREKEALQKIAKKAEGGTDSLLMKLVDHKYTTPIVWGATLLITVFIAWLIFG